MYQVTAVSSSSLWELLSCFHAEGEFKCRVNQEGVCVCYPWHRTAESFSLGKSFEFVRWMKESNSCNISKERKKRWSNSKWLYNILGFSLRDESFLHLDHWDHSPTAVCWLSLHGHDTISQHFWRCLWRECQIFKQLLMPTTSLGDYFLD